MVLCSFLVVASGAAPVAPGLPGLVAGRPLDAQRPAELVLRGADVYTMDAARSWAAAVAVRDGRIAYVGPDAGVEQWIGPGTRVLELAGRMVLPGFHDTHVHPISGGVERTQCDLNEADTRQAVLDAIRACAADLEEGEWLVGGGWDLPIFPGGIARAATLDSIVGDRPAYLGSSDGHSAWVSAGALRIAGVDASTPDPPEGRIDRNAAGAPIGTLRESAMDLVARHLPELTVGERLDGLRIALADANRFGITSLVEASAGEAALEAYRAADRAGALTARVIASQLVDPRRGTEQLAALVERRARYGGGRLRADAAKIFADGVIEARTGALLAPYVGTPMDSGTMNVEPGRLRALVTALDSAGFQLHVHAIGDRAIRETLDAIEAARRRNGVRDARHHMAHIQLWDPVDIPRLRELRVIANIQPVWAYAEPYITELTEPVVGPARSRWLYPFRSLLESGAVVAAGSDWSVTTMNPLDAIQVAVTRQALDGSTPPWIPEERAPLADMVAAYTINGAYLMRQEEKTGSIEVGKAADLVVLERNLFDVEPREIHRVRVLMTLLEGDIVFEAGAQSGRR